MSGVKPTAGEWVARPDPNSNPGDHPHGDYVVGVGDRIDEIATCTTYRHATLIAEAGNAFKSTGLTPRQLAEQRDELAAALDDALEAIRDGDAQSAKNTLTAALAKARGQ